MTLRVRLGLLLATAAAGGALLWRWPGPPAAVAPAAETLACRLSVGDELAYRVHLVSKTGADAAQAVDLQAAMFWRVLAPRGTGWLISATLEGTRLEASGEVSPAAADLQEPFLIDVGRDCRFKSLAFGPRVEAGARAQLQALLGALEVVLPVMPVTAWSTRQRDSAGEYLAQHQRQGAEIQRRRTRYLRTHASSTSPVRVAPRLDITRSQARITLAPDGRWLAGFSSDEVLALSVEDRDLGQVTVRVELSQIRQAAPARLKGLAADRFVWSDPSTALPVRAVPKAPDAKLAAMDLGGALAVFGQKLARKGGLHDAVTTLAGYLARHPEAITKLMERLRQGSRSGLDDDTRSALFLALELTGSPEAEKALGAAIADARLVEVDRMRAAAALADVAHPSPQAFEALVAGARLSSEQDVAGTSLLALGTLGHNVATSQPAMAATVRDELSARLAGKGAEVIPVLDAAGNFGDVALLGAVAPHTSDPSPMVRSHAAGAFRRSSDPSGEATLIAWLQREPDATVRRHIVESLAERVPAAGGGLSPALLAVAVARLPVEVDPQVRGLLIDLLGGSAGSAPEARRALIEQFGREPRVELQQRIGRYCSAEDLR
jgi:hypothetical protein